MKQIFLTQDWRPTSENNTLQKQFARQTELNKLNAKRNQSKKAVLDTENKEYEFKTFCDNPPKWNPKTNKYVNNFSGRVTEASIKNFQLVPQVEGKL